MAYHARAGGLWKTVKNLYVRRDGQWLPVRKAFKKINGVWTQYFQGEVIAILNAIGTGPVAVNYFTAADWANPLLTKRLVIPAGQEIGTNNSTYALAISSSANGQAGSFAGDLIIDNNGIISGLSGAPNSGAGGNAVWANLPGRDGRRSILNNYGTIRGGGGAGGIGGAGGGGFYDQSRRATEGPRFDTWSWWRVSYNNEGSISGAGARWDGIQEWTMPFNNQDGTTFVSGDNTYIRGARTNNDPRVYSYQVSRQYTVWDRFYTSGGGGGNGGRGQGYGVGNAGGNGGGSPGTNAGWGGTGGTGGTWGMPGNAGGAGGNGNNGGGAAGGGGGLAGAYLSLGNNMTLNNFGTLQGRLILT